MANTSIDWSLILSGLAIAVATFTWWRGHVLANRVAAIEIERRLEELSSRALADLVAHFERGFTPARSPSYRLILENRGPATAREVSFSFLGDPKHSPALHGNEFEGPLAIEAKQSIDIPVIFHSQLRLLQEIRLEWTDDAGTHDKVVQVSTA